MKAGVWLGLKSLMRLVSRYSRLLLALSVALFGWESSKAEFSLPESVQVHGFASLGYFNTTDNNFFGDTKRDSGDVDFWELGINGSWRPLPDLQLSMQVVSRRAGETDDGDLRIDYGFLDYSFISDVDDLWGIRLGRVVNPFGFYNDTRDMPFTRPSILLPQSIYFDRNRQFSLSSDGGQLYGERRTDIGTFSLQLQVAYPRTDDPDLRRTILGTAPAELKGKTSFLGRLMYEKDQGKFRLALSSIKARTKFEPGGPDIKDGRFNFAPIYLSAQYNAERWSLTSEYALRRTEIMGFGPSLPDTDFTGESYYIQGTFRLSQRWEGVLRYDVLYLDRDDRDGKKREAATGGARTAHSRFAKDLTIGVRWDVVPNFLLRFEYHNVNGTAWISDLENPDERTQRWNLFVLLGAFRF
jgi:hypothetical protein